MKAYFDNAATTQVIPEVAREMQSYLTKEYGNPSSLHYKGMAADRALTKARQTIARAINAEPEEIIFTSSATEANNTALFGIMEYYKDKGDHLITTKIEHASVKESCRRLEQTGFNVTWLDIDSEGFIDLEQMKKAITDRTVLVSIIHGNHEIGTIQDLETIGKLCRSKGIIFHTDASQSFTKTYLDVRKQNIDLLSINAHKIHGPKGVGALYVRKGIKFHKRHYGGSQEFNLRAGTENMPGIMGFAKAVEIAIKEKQKNITYVSRLRKRLADELMKIDGVTINGPQLAHFEKRLCNNLNVRIKYIEGEATLMRLSMEGICVSTGSACSSKSLAPSHILKALGQSDLEAHNSIRFSLSKLNTIKEVDYVAKKLKEVAAQLRAISPLGHGA